MRPSSPVLATLALPLALVLALALGGCGKSDDELVAEPTADGATAAVNQFVTALEDGDPQAACAQLAAEAQRSFERAQGAADCITAIDRAGAAATDVSDVDSGDVTVEGDRATVAGEEADQLAELLGMDGLTLTRVDARWAIG